MRLTIAVANWNRAWFLDRSIYLMSKQTLNQDEFEYLIVDDGSTDESDAVIRKYINQGIIKNFRYFRRKNLKTESGNCSTARNIGITGSTGDYIIFADPEVMPLPDWAEYHCLDHVCDLVPTKDLNRIDTGVTSAHPLQTLETSPPPTFRRTVVGMTLATRHFNGPPFSRPVHGNVYADYDWFNIVDTYDRLISDIRKVQSELGLSPKQIRDEWFFHIATMAGWSLPRRWLMEVGGWEENFANPALGLNVWAGEDTWMSIVANRSGMQTVEECKARAVHIHHHVDNAGCKGPSYASKYAEENPTVKQSNIGREWGIIDNRYERIA